MADKGINLPESALRLPSLTSKDLADLRFIAANADIVGYSFVRTESDVFDLQERLEELGGEQLGIVLKVETIRAFENLPGLLLAAMRSPCAGVMIARGDLAIECGFERMAEVQEEILWICEAAHMPVIWATQVLEKLAKEGLPSRAEITDAAMGERAECVMLNKGPYIVEAVRALDDIMRRMQAHQRKKSAMLRPLSVAFKFTQTA
jgi:pyruvate kinase